MKNKPIALPYLDSDYSQRFLDLSKEWYWELDESARITHCSPQVLNLLSYRAEELIGRKFISLMSQNNQSQQGAAVFAQQRVRQQESIENLVCGFYDKQQQLHYLELNAEAFFDGNGKWLGYHGIARNLPAHVDLEKTLHNLADGISANTGEAFFRSLVSHLANLLNVDYALVGEFSEQRPGMVRVLVVHARGEISEDFCYPLEGTPCEEVFNGKLSCYSRDVQKIFPDDPMLPDMGAASYLGAPLFNSNGQIGGILAVIHSKPFAHLDYIQSLFRLYVTRAAAELERQQMVNNLQRMAHQDDLTGLCNRNLFITLLDRSLSRARRNDQNVALMFLDLDRFKDINDTLGHEAGDKVLTIIAQRLKQTIREEDTIARIGGDEFMILLGETNNINDTRRVAEKIIQILNKPIQLELHELHVTTSIGIGIYPIDGDDVSTLMKNADIALYRAKSIGRNTYQLYSRDMGQALQQKLDVEKDLRNAISRQEFTLHYQPKIDLTTGAVCGAEALIRWNHPTDGLVAPESFISLLEETGGIVEVGSWVLNTALQDMRRCTTDLNCDISLAVNVSARQFREADFLEKLTSSLKNSNFSPKNLELEITETVLMEEGNHITELLYKIKAMGIRISLDDFGTGYSSLMYLRRYPIDTIKIDKSFVFNISEDNDDRVLVKALIELAQALKLGVIAEGVETNAQLDILKSFNCENIQGYFFSPPIAIAEFKQYLKNNLQEKVAPSPPPAQQIPLNLGKISTQNN